jgi:hypothetical protein
MEVSPCGIEGDWLVVREEVLQKRQEDVRLLHAAEGLVLLGRQHLTDALRRDTRSTPCFWPVET